MENGFRVLRRRRRPASCRVRLAGIVIYLLMLQMLAWAQSYTCAGPPSTWPPAPKVTGFTVPASVTGGAYLSYSIQLDKPVPAGCLLMLQLSNDPQNLVKNPPTLNADINGSGAWQTQPVNVDTRVTLRVRGTASSSSPAACPGWTQCSDVWITKNGGGPPNPGRGSCLAYPVADWPHVTGGLYGGQTGRGFIRMIL